MDRHARCDEVKAKRRPPSEDVRASIESELARGERLAAGDVPDVNGQSGQTLRRHDF